MQKESPKESKTKPKTEPKKKTKISFRQILVILALPIWAAAIILFSQYLIAYALYFLIGYERLSTPVWTTLANALVYSLSLFLIIFLPRKILKKSLPSREELGLKNLPTWIDIGLAIAGFIIYFVLATVLVQLFSIFPFFDASEAQDVGFNVLNSGLDRLVALVALVIVAPVFEEIIFRGWLYGKLRDKIPKRYSLVLSILITSLTFALLHGQWNVGVNVFAMSIVLCALREITGTIYSGILLHILKNGIAFALLYIVNIGF